jgi:hypothetical protein
VILSTEGRAFTVPVASLPDGRGMGAPLSSFVELGGGKIAHVLTGSRRTNCCCQDLGLRLHLHLRRSALAAEGRQGLPDRRRRRRHPAAAARLPARIISPRYPKMADCSSSRSTR